MILAYLRWDELGLLQLGMEDDSVNLMEFKGIGGNIIINGSPKDRRVSSVNKQYHQKGFFKRLITDFETRALRKNDPGWRRRACSKHESAWCFKVIFNSESWVSVRSSGMGTEERHPLKILHAALSRISDWLVRHINLLLFLVTHSMRVCSFVLVISTRACDRRSIFIDIL